jgi:DNA-binding NarL/FixJ family response regulator
MNLWRIVIAEDHQGFKQLLRLELDLIPGLEIVGEVEDGLQLLNLLKWVQVDLVIMDISMPNLNGLETAKIIKAQYCDIKVLFLTMHKSPAYVEQARLIGAEGYLLKDDIDRELLSAINLIKEGESYVSLSLA